MKAEKPIRKKAMIGGRMFDIIDTTREGELEKKLAEKNKEIAEIKKEHLDSLDLCNKLREEIERLKSELSYYTEGQINPLVDMQVNQALSELRDEIKKISQDNGAYIRAYRKKVLELLEEKPKKIWG